VLKRALLLNLKGLLTVNPLALFRFLRIYQMQVSIVSTKMGFLTL